MDHLRWLLGLTNQDDPFYLLFTGIGPIVVGVGVYLGHHNCHERRCLRPGHVQPDGSVLCRRHRPRSSRAEEGD